MLPLRLTAPKHLSRGGLLALRSAQELLAVLEARATALKARLQQQLHPPCPVHQGVDLFELAHGEGPPARRRRRAGRSEEHTSELQSQSNLVCRLLLEKKKKPEDHALLTNTIQRAA